MCYFNKTKAKTLINTGFCYDLGDRIFVLQQILQLLSLQPEKIEPVGTKTRQALFSLVLPCIRFLQLVVLLYYYLYKT